MKTIAEIQQAVTDHILTLMEKHEKGEPLWNRFVRRFAENGEHHNATTLRPYSGINPLILAVTAQLQGYNSNAWATFKQIQGRAGWKLRKGSKGQFITFWQPIKGKDKVTGEEKVFPLLKYYYVFNMDCVEGFEPRETPPAPEGIAIPDIVSKVADEAGINWRTHGNEAYYSPMTDSVTIPAPALFTKPENFAHVAFHEFCHWTGHASRLDRIKVGAVFGSEAYAFEELCAELGAAYMLARFNMGESQYPNHASYLNSWIKALKGDRTFIFKSAKEASKAAEFLAPVEVDEVTE